jgi:hypothetical protein
VFTCSRRRRPGKRELEVNHLAGGSRSSRARSSSASLVAQSVRQGSHFPSWLGLEGQALDRAPSNNEMKLTRSAFFTDGAALAAYLGVLRTTVEGADRISMTFRMAFGTCRCEQPYRDAVQSKACEAIDARLANWLSRLPADLRAMPTEMYEDELVEGHWITFGMHKHLLTTGDTLIVFQALVRTWVWPTFISVGAVGRMYAEGILVSAGTAQRAPDEIMWEFR